MNTEMTYWQNYYTEVLGVDSILDAALDPQIAVIKIETCDLLIINVKTQDKEDWNKSAVKDLYTKMKAAMKLDHLQVIEWQVEDSVFKKDHEKEILLQKVLQKFQAQFVLVFSSFPFKMGELRLVSHSQWIETYSPAYLLEDGASKKIVWQDLQKLMGALKTQENASNKNKNNASDN